MAKQTQLLKITFPSELEEPFSASHEQGMTEIDQILFANAENGNLLWSGGGIVSWNAGTNTLTWASDVKITAMSTGPRFATIATGSVELQDGEVVFFQMPRLLSANQAVSLMRSNRVFEAGVRLNNLRIFAARIGDTVVFGNGASLLDGESGTIFGGGLGSGSGGITQVTSTNSTIIVGSPLGPTVNIDVAFAGSGGTFGVANTSARSDHSHAGVTHTHEPQLSIVPGAGVTVLNLNADALITAKTLIKVWIYRNGVLQVEGSQLTVNLGAKTATLTSAALATDRFIIERVTT